MGADGKFYFSDKKGTLGGYSKNKIYGRLDCPSALRAIAKGGYVKYRVFFEDEETAIAAGYRPCGICMPKKYKAWKQLQENEMIRVSNPNMKLNLEIKQKCSWFWLMGIHKVQIDKCYSKCFIGDVFNKIYEQTKYQDKAIVALDIVPSTKVKAYYLCGLSKGFKYENNTHVAFVPAEGNVIQIDNERITLKITDAREIHFQDYKPNPEGEYSDEQRVCRNWIFANYLRDGMPL